MYYWKCANHVHYHFYEKIERNCTGSLKQLPIVDMCGMQLYILLVTMTGFAKGNTGKKFWFKCKLVSMASLFVVFMQSSLSNEWVQNQMTALKELVIIWCPRVVPNCFTWGHGVHYKTERTQFIIIYNPKCFYGLFIECKLWSAKLWQKYSRSEIFLDWSHQYMIYLLLLLLSMCGIEWTNKIWFDLDCWCCF